MAEQSPETPAKAGGKSGWFKAFVGTLAGLLSGAAAMYLTPLVDKVVKPPRPVANFAVEHQGLAVTFHNSSSGGEGWWDFGDGTALEPASASQPSVTHTYAQPGTYTAKLTLRNLLNEENERTVTLNLDGSGAVGGAPAIVSLDAVPVGGHGCCAPATFRLTCKTKNAEVLVWDCGDEAPLQVVNDPATDSDPDRYVTFDKPGGYVIKLAAITGKQYQVKDTIINVDVPPPGTLTAVLSVACSATRAEKTERAITVTETFTAQGTDVQPISRPVAARPGYEITAARVEVAGGRGGKDLRVQVASDRRSAQLTGELVRESAGPLKLVKTQPNLTMRVTLTEEKNSCTKRATIPLSTTLAVPGTAVLTLPPCPCDWRDVQRQLRLELRDGEHVLWPDSQLPHNAVVTYRGRKWVLNATPVGDQVRVEVGEVTPGRLSAN